MSEYPRKIVIENEKLRKLLTEKEALVNEGRAKDALIQETEEEMKKINDEMVELEKKVDISYLKAEADKLTEQANAIITQMEEMNKKTRERIVSQMPVELKEKYDALNKQKETLESERNKIAHKVQKWRDKCIPLGQKLMRPHLIEEFDDFDTIRIENGEIVCTIFNHLVDFKTNFKDKFGNITKTKKEEPESPTPPIATA